jgi:acyl-coenzyme A thioesterase PaaI-like protein
MRMRAVACSVILARMTTVDAPLDGHLFGPGQPCFGCGPDHPYGFRLRFERDGDEIFTRFTASDRYQGPPGIMHGGLVSTLADEVAAWAIIALRGKFGFTASFDAKLHTPVRIGVPLVGRAHIVKDARRIIDVGVRIVQEDADAFTGSFRFVILDQGGAEKMLRGPIPEAWQRFTR